MLLGIIHLNIDKGGKKITYLDILFFQKNLTMVIDNFKVQVYVFAVVILFICQCFGQTNFQNSTNSISFWLFFSYFAFPFYLNIFSKTINSIVFLVNILTRRKVFATQRKRLTFTKCIFFVINSKNLEMLKQIFTAVINQLK